MGCRQGDLRGTWSDSDDGGTYLSIDEPNGSCRLHVDGQPWPHRIGEAGRVEPGSHEIHCGNPDLVYRVEVQPGTTYRFNYWGP